MKISETTKEKVNKHSQIIFCVLAWILLICIVIQVSLASMAVFVNDDIWGKHLAFVKVIEYIPAFMYIFGSAALKVCDRIITLFFVERNVSKMLNVEVNATVM
ncbi:DUF6220 domain-containing protein [Robertmurraya massiliosenegalensis]|uniref:DUF6220 domain-containing protein n=1 Tax=Robertmurraya TaxID=2837507 RepID=UPI0039A443FD